MNSKFFSQAEAFVAVARNGSITEAAHALRVSKSNVSQKLSEFEQDLDLKLFERTTRKITLTPAGKTLLAKCAKAVDGVSYVRSEFGVQGQSGADISGVVTLSGSNIYLTEYVLPKLHNFFEMYPNIRLRAVGSDHPIDPLANGVDLRIRIGDVNPSGVRVFPLQSIERVLCIGVSAKLDTSGIDHPRQLDRVPVILREQENPVWNFHHKFTEWQLKTTGPQLLVNSYEMSVQAVRNGYGMAILAKSIVSNDIIEGRIVQLIPDWQVSPLPVSLTVVYSKLTKPHIKALSSYLTQTLG